MSVGILVLTLIILAAVGLGLAFLASLVNPEARATRAERRQDAAEIAEVRAREKIATKALRAIANGAGNPIFEAQDALDNIESTYIKEIN